MRSTPAPHSFTVRCGAERFAAPRLVIAAGLGSREPGTDGRLSMPVTPLHGQIIVTERLRPFLDYATHTLRQTAEGSVMLGDSQEDVGFDTRTRVPVLQDIAARNLQVFPALKDATIVRMWAALRVMSPDGFPIYEQSPRYPGAFAATCHSGVTLAGAHALALAPAILAGELPERFAAFCQQAVRCSGGLTRRRAKSGFPSRDASVIARPGDQRGGGIACRRRALAARYAVSRCAARAVLHDGRVLRMPGGDRRRRQPAGLPDAGCARACRCAVSAARESVL